MSKVNLQPLQFVICVFLLSIPFLAPAYSQTAGTPSQSQQSSAEVDATDAKNPLSSNASVQFQSVTSFGLGPNDDVGETINVNMFKPLNFNDKYRLLTRAVVPFVYLPDLGTGSDSMGLGDTSVSAWISPKAPTRVGRGTFLWGLGGGLGLPTATEDGLGREKFTFGPSVILVYLSRGFVAGAAISNDFSIAGSDSAPDVNRMTLSPFVSYSLRDGWALATAPTITADWDAPSDSRWTIPLGGGISKSWKGPDGKTRSFGIEAYHFVEAPPFAADWQIKTQYKWNF